MKVGDRVKVVADHCEDRGDYRGHDGEIIKEEEKEVRVPKRVPGFYVKLRRVTRPLWFDPSELQVVGEDDNS